ncbi:ricin-type beta-trefoil lectin domain protein [Dactylosporangium sucinum]|uniref:Ricin B lectin domain-containing protein n=1 Tax=Dactylosporangium sucinum TaxID=1424081 RepID=A0A917U4E0_9ACTN|nr:RICIN domain-containing protein [Dactylosporangium sucinum]GGM54185.1 hypothetical protein GCM10007977_064760 [Dactylosporangium sucinum]
MTAYDTMDARPIPLDPRREPVLVRPYVSALDDPPPMDRTDWPVGGKVQRKPGATIPAELRGRSAKGGQPAREGRPRTRHDWFGATAAPARTAGDDEPARVVPLARGADVPQARVAEDAVQPRGGHRDAEWAQDAAQARGGQPRVAAGGGARAVRPSTPFGTPAEPDSVARVAEDMPEPRSARPARPSRAAATGGDRRTGQARAAQRGAARAVPPDHHTGSPEPVTHRQTITRAERRAAERAAARGEKRVLSRSEAQAAARGEKRVVTRSDPQAVTRGEKRVLTRSEARAMARSEQRRRRARRGTHGDYRRRHSGGAASGRAGGRRRGPALGWGVLALTVGTTGLVLGVHEQAAMPMPTAVALTSPQPVRAHTATAPAPADGEQGARAAAAGRTRAPHTPGSTTGAPAGSTAPGRAPLPPSTGPIVSHDGKCLDGAALLLANCDDSDTQVWTAAGDGTLRLAGQCLQAGGAALVIQPCDGSAGQSWGRIAQPGDAAEVASVASGLCLDPGLGTVPGLANCDGTADQRWQLP